MDADELIQKTVRFPKVLIDEVESILSMPGNEELDFAGFARTALRNEIKKAREERMQAAAGA